MTESTATGSVRRTVPVRLESGLHRQVTLMARLADVSVNDLICSAIEAKLAELQQDSGIRERAAQLQQAIAEDAQAQAEALAGLIAPPSEPSARRKSTPSA